MYTIEVFLNFSAAHRLRHYKGKCENIHGHNWKVGVSISSKTPNHIGIVADFRDVKKILKGVLEKLDHKDLNAIAYFKKVNPTSENLAKYIYDELKKKKLKPSSVSVWEADDSKAEYRE
ncbi:MAG: 6-carboxytetrahydropterin synthase QueD [Candidatus Omnitrophica bacterium]|nr:6-carboxytetrahydropterin synthase QueD [Candidatus Omnitrophota bacterium]MBU4487688.1 6-carboxytetrahydropterin synthase QueD [Candidatus Omnitrophota bacterium]MCG2704815.1 6-carboxytetrahydropterin synthase QueD [Candidatus Omnitrophota bacterium]